MNNRIGFGLDVHRLSEGEELIIGGVKIPHSRGTVAHSDGDALIHAVCDALLGAACLGDIGQHFPDSSPDYKGISSSILLKKVSEMISEKGYHIINIDSVVCLQKPKISEYFPDMRNCMASLLNISSAQISVKATTAENLGFIGKEEGIVCFATVLLSLSGLKKP